MTPEQRADAVMDAFSKADLAHGARTVLLALITEAVRAAENEALERAESDIGSLAEPCGDYCEHDYCVAVHDARSKVSALLSTP